VCSDEAWVDKKKRILGAEKKKNKKREKKPID